MLFLTAALEKNYYSAAILRQHSWDGYDFYMVWRKHHEKRIVALLLGGVLAVGSLAVPMTVQAVTMSECSFESLPHIRNLISILKLFTLEDLGIKGFDAASPTMKLIPVRVRWDSDGSMIPGLEKALED